MTSKGEVSDLFSHLYNRDWQSANFRRIYADERPLLEALLKNHFPEKCKIKVLQEVLEAFHAGWHPECESNVYFNYDEQTWKGTIVHEKNASYTIRGNPSLVSFVNIKLPNDGYFYTGDYEDAGSLTDKKEDATDFINKVATILVARVIMIEDDGDFTFVDYSETRQCLAIYFWKKDEKSCVTVKSENGHHESAYTQDRKKFARILQKKQK